MRKSFGWAYIALIVLLVFSNHIHDFVNDIYYKIERMSISQSELNRPMYSGPGHRWTGRLDKKDLVSYEPRFENYNWKQ